MSTQFEILAINYKCLGLVHNANTNFDFRKYFDQFWLKSFCYVGARVGLVEGGVSLSQVSLAGRVLGSGETNHKQTIGIITKRPNSKRFELLVAGEGERAFSKDNYWEVRNISYESLYLIANS